jgi:hypothetical protein
VLASQEDKFFIVDACLYVWSSVVMPREEIGPIPKAEIDLAIARLRAFQIHLEQMQKWFIDHESEVKTSELWVWRYKSLERGLVALETLPTEFMRSIHAFSRGNPQGPSSTKTRGSKKILEEHKKTLDAKRSKKKT